jgi:hypothetical protein
MSRESRLSNKLRPLLRALEVDVVQLLDAGIPGPSDLHLEWIGRSGALTMWLELKAGSTVRQEQITFLQRHWSKYQNAYLYEASSDGLFRLFRGCDAALRPDPATAVSVLSRVDARVLLEVMETWSVIRTLNVFVCT